MAYNGRQDRYQEVQYQSRPQKQGNRYNDYSQNQYGQPAAAFQQYDQGHDGYQQAAYDHNQQYDANHAPSWDQRAGQAKYQQENLGDYRSAQAPQQQYQQPRQYQYDDRFRRNDNNSRQEGERRGNMPEGRRSPQSSRPGTSASSRKQQQERILDRAKIDAPKAVPWDNPFGVFPGTKKDLEKKKKEADEARSRSRTETPADRPATSSSSRPNLADQSSGLKTTTKQSFEQQRPHTSQGRRPQSPQTNFNSFNQPLGVSDSMPLRKQPPPSRQQEQFSGSGRQQIPPAAQPANLGLPERPAAFRSASGPLPDRPPLSPNPKMMPQNPYAPPPQDRSHDFGNHRQASFEQNRGNARNNGYEYNTGEIYAEYDAFPDSNKPARTMATARENAYQTPARHENSKQPNPKSYGDLNARDIDPPMPQTKPRDSLVPDFAAMAPDATENVEKELTLQSKPVAYRKPTYGDASSKHRTDRPGLAMPQDVSHDYIQSPTRDYDIGMPVSQSSASQAQSRQPDPRYGNRSDARGQHEHSGDGQNYIDDQRQPSARNDSRGESRPQDARQGFTHPYSQPSARQRPDQARQPDSARPDRSNQNYNQPYHAPREDYGFDDHGYPQNHQYNDAYDHTYDYEHNYDQSTYQQDAYQERHPLTRAYTDSSDYNGHDHYNHGYKQQGSLRSPQDGQFQYPAEQYQAPGYSAQYNRGEAVDQYGNQTPSRPRTANSARPPVPQYPEQPMPTSRPPQSGFPVADRNHPIPFRPGLMQSTPAPVAAPSPAPPVQVSPPRVPQGPPQGPSPNTRQQETIPRKNPVTIQELNDLRAKFKDRPNDDKLGLVFAKKLVEAATVLANEGGRADPKTTAKNRERYINDAYRIVKRLVGNGSADAMFYLADCYGQGQLGLEVNAREAFQLYTSAAKVGHAQSAYRVAVCCELGPEGGGGTRRDHVKAVQFYKRAATLGDGPAMFKMGMILLKGLLGQQPNRREGISWLKRASERADADNPHSLHELALLYETAQPNDVVIRDERYALQLFTQSANLGYKYSQFRLGSAYEYGTLGLAIDPRQSIAWYTRAAAQGEHQSEFALSGWYLTGSEPLLEQSDQEAYLWARKAAQSGLAKAEYAMGYYTEVGIGVTSNIEEAKKWYFRAAAQMDNRAKQRLEELKRGGARKEKTRISRSNIGRQNEGECSVM